MHQCTQNERGGCHPLLLMTAGRRYRTSGIRRKIDEDKGRSGTLAGHGAISRGDDRAKDTRKRSVSISQENGKSFQKFSDCGLPTRRRRRSPHKKNCLAWADLSRVDIFRRSGRLFAAIGLSVVRDRDRTHLKAWLKSGPPAVHPG